MLIYGENMDDQQFESLVERLVKLNKANGNGNGKRIPMTWQELLYDAAKTLGVPTVVCGVLLLMAYQTLPGYVEENNKTQQVMRENMEAQTDNMEAQTDNTAAILASLKESAKIEKDTAEFMPQVLEDHQTFNEAFVAFTTRVSEERKAEQEAVAIDYERQEQNLRDHQEIIASQVEILEAVTKGP